MSEETVIKILIKTDCTVWISAANVPSVDRFCGLLLESILSRQPETITLDAIFEEMQRSKGYCGRVKVALFILCLYSH